MLVIKPVYVYVEGGRCSNDGCVGGVAEFMGR